MLEPATLARAYASADIAAQPAIVEELSNAVLEASSSGLPVLVAESSGSGRFVVEGETGLIVPDSEPASWARALHALLENRARLRAMGHAARAWSLRNVPTWHEVLVDDLLPVWRQLAFSVGTRRRLPANDGGRRCRELGARLRRHPMKVLFCHPSGLMYTEIFLRLEPLGVELCAEAARRAGHQVRVLDLQAASQDDYRRVIDTWRPDAIGFGVNYLANIPEVIDLARETRRRLPQRAVLRRRPQRFVHREGDPGARRAARSTAWCAARARRSRRACSTRPRTIARRCTRCPAW